MSDNKKKEQQSRVNTRRVTEGQKRVKPIKPTNPSNQEGGQKRVVRDPKGKRK